VSTPLTRRDLLRCVVVAAVVPAPSLGCGSDETPAAPVPVEDGKAHFPQSVASGDPRSDAVVLWTRVIDGDASADRLVTLEVSATEDFKSFVVKKAGLPALAANDGTLKVKVTGLSPKTRYYFRFVYVKEGKRYGSPVGRTKTAPAAGDDAAVTFVVASCQDYVGRYYNAWAHLLQSTEEIDFVLFVGDYIYETTGDPGFQKTTPDRTIKFTNEKEALDLGEYRAAKSLGNYRDLYKTFRSEPILQKVHERFPFVQIWDDHEYSDDCWGDVATYSDGLKSERDTDRRKNAERAFFEFVPFDPPGGPAPSEAGVLEPSGVPVFPQTRVYRELDFGKHLKVIVTDYRTYRPDHVIPEDAFPAEVILDDAAMQASGLATAFTSDSFSYVNIDDPAYQQPVAAGRPSYKDTFKAGIKYLLARSNIVGADADAKADALVKGNMALVFVNGVLTNPLINAPPIDPVGKPKGLAWIHFGKQDLYGLRGSRYFLFKGTFEAYSAYLYAKTQGKSENAWGDAQEAWFKETLGKSAATFNVVASSVTMTNLSVDLTQKTDITESSLRQKFLANCDQWDGFPNKRKAILDFIKQSGKSVVFVAGDIHAAFASTEGGVPVLTSPAISSGSFRELLSNALGDAGYKEGTPVYKYAVTELDQTFKDGNPNLLVSKQEQGYLLVKVSAAEVKATFYTAAESIVQKKLYDDASLGGSFKPTVVTVSGGTLKAG
jgi:alkaline phosphatase D